LKKFLFDPKVLLGSAFLDYADTPTLSGQGLEPGNERCCKVFSCQQTNRLEDETDVQQGRLRSPASADGGDS
jgi:hypothetical protein